MREATISALPYQRFAGILSPSAYLQFDQAMRQGAQAMHGRTLWQVNSTLTGGGVAELLGATIPYAQAAGIRCRWVAIDGEPAFLDITKRLHNHLHGFPGDGRPLGQAEKHHYSEVIAMNAAEIAPMVQPNDVVIVHDPQPAGLIPTLKNLGAQVIWQCHIGTGTPNALTRQAWQFLTADVSAADAYVFSRAEFAWDGLEHDRLHVISPSINPFSAKNQNLENETVNAILNGCGLLAGAPATQPAYTREDGTAAQVHTPVGFLGASGPVPRDAVVVLQVGRWDRIKDPEGVINLFTEHLAQRHHGVHLVLAGPSVNGVSDDPEGAEVAAQCAQLHQTLASDLQARVHLVSCPMDDRQENEAIINALQRRAQVVLVKSQAEGFGLVVAEAMWKRRPVVASAVGGIQDQIKHGVSGILIGDPADNGAFAAAVGQLLQNRRRAAQIGDNAHQRVLDHFLSSRQLTQIMNLLATLPPGPIPATRQHPDLSPGTTKARSSTH
jgi:trehalose synthase